MKKIILLLIPLLLIIFAGLIFKSKIIREEKIHYHAGFLVYVDGILQDFTDNKYMEVIPCNVSGKENPSDDQKEKAHLHDNIGDVVHVEHSGAVWSDLFKNINFSFPENQQITGYVNGYPVSDILSRPVKPNDSSVFIAGDGSRVNLRHYVSSDHIIEVESKSENCGSIPENTNTL